MKFTEFGFDDRLMEGIDATNYSVATPIQEKVMPLILEGKDLMGIAQTGTGKTAAFLLPLIQRVISSKAPVKGIQALVIVPTRELAIQVSQLLEGLSYFTGVSSIAIYGGGDGIDFVQEKKALVMGAEFVICTPGKMMAHIKMGYANLGHLKYLVLDEADRMLDMGFYDDIMYIINHLPAKRQTLMFSATMPPKIKKLANAILKSPAEVNIAIGKPPDRLEQQAFVVNPEEKISFVEKILSENSYGSVLVFCSSKQSVKQLTRDLVRKGMKAAEIHSDLEQAQREETLMQFRSRRLPILVATDILSRGIDIDNIELIINYDVPHNGEDYVHRIGRTARAEAGGLAITLVSPRDIRKFHHIERLIERKLLPPQHGGSRPAKNRPKRQTGRRPKR